MPKNWICFFPRTPCRSITPTRVSAAANVLYRDRAGKAADASAFQPRGNALDDGGCGLRTVMGAAHGSRPHAGESDQDHSHHQPRSGRDAQCYQPVDAVPLFGAIEPYFYPKKRDGIFKRTLFIAPPRTFYTGTARPWPPSRRSLSGICVYAGL